MTTTTTNTAAEQRPFTPKGKTMPKAASSAGAPNTGMNGGKHAPAGPTPMGRAGQMGGMTEISMPKNGKHATHAHVKKAPGSRTS